MEEAESYLPVPVISIECGESTSEDTWSGDHRRAASLDSLDKTIAGTIASENTTLYPQRLVGLDTSREDEWGKRPTTKDQITSDMPGEDSGLHTREMSPSQPPLPHDALPGMGNEEKLIVKISLIIPIFNKTWGKQALSHNISGSKLL